MGYTMMPITKEKNEVWESCFKKYKKYKIWYQHPLTSVRGIPISVTPTEMEKGLVLHKGHSPSSYARDCSASRARPITPHTPSPIDLGCSQQCGIAQSRPNSLSRPSKPSPTRGNGGMFIPAQQGYVTLSVK